jgi:hypothetical protein
VAVVKVTAVQNQGGDTVLTTTPANLNDAISRGTLGFTRPVSWNSLPPSAFKQAAYAAGLHPQLASLRVPSNPITFKGKVNGFDTSLTLDPQSDGKLNFSVEVSRSNIKVTATGWLSSFTSDAKLVYNPATGDLFSAHVKGLQGEADLKWDALGVGSPQDNDTPYVSLPLSVPIPIEVGPIPMVLTVKSTMRFAPELTAQSSSAGSIHTTYDSDYGFNFDKSVPTRSPPCATRSPRSARATRSPRPCRRSRSAGAGSFHGWSSAWAPRARLRSCPSTHPCPASSRLARC